MHQQRILIVEEDGVTRLMLEMQLQQAKYTTIGVGSSEIALDQLGRERFDLLITELRLSNIDGLQLIARARAIDPGIAIIILTGSASTSSAVSALNQQVHRYLLKPVRPAELVQHVAAVLAPRHRIAEHSPSYHTQQSAQHADPVLRVGALSIDPDRHQVTYGERAIPLSHGEFSLLLYLTYRRGAVVSPQEIARDVLRYPCSPQEAQNLSKSRIHALRRKIAAYPAASKLIHNVRGAGYRLLDNDELEAYQ